MSILSRFLKRDDREGDHSTFAPTGRAVARAGAVPAAEYPAQAEKTDANLVPQDGPGGDAGPAAAAVAETSASPPVISAAAVEDAFRKLVVAAEPGAMPARTAADQAADRAAVRSTFEELAVGHVAPLRNLMLEVRWGDAQTRWIELCRPALRSLRAMAAQIELEELVSALDELGIALDQAAQAGGSAITGPTREALLGAYLPLARHLARAFAIDGERDRREPLIVEALLQQVPGLDPLLLVKLSAVGLARLENLLRASAEEIACVAGVPQAVAAAVVEKVAEFQRSTPVNLTSDANALRRPLEPLLARLEAQHQSFERSCSGWSTEEVAAKRLARQERERAYLAVKAALARLGEVDLVLELDRLPYGKRIEQLGRFLRQAGEGPPSASTHNPQHAARTNQGGKEGAGHGRAHA